MRKEPWVEQQERKYADHDFALEDMKPADLCNIKGIAIRTFVDAAETDVTKLTISAFMGYLKAQGFRIVKEKK